jgi:hypothetical protein
MLWFKEYTAYENGARRPLLTPAPATFPMGPFDKVFLYYDTASATMIITYYAYLILLNQQVAQSEEQGDTDDKKSQDKTAIDENQELAQWICMSIYYCARLAGCCGTSALTMVLPIARAVLPSEYHGWMAQW